MPLIVSYAFKTLLRTGFNKPKGAYCCFQIEDLNQPFVSQRETIRNHGFPKAARAVCAALAAHRKQSCALHKHARAKPLIVSQRETMVLKSLILRAKRLIMVTDAPANKKYVLRLILSFA